MKRTLLVLAPAALLAACAAAPAPPPPIHATVTLLPATRTELAPGTSLHYERAQDSRCPREAHCVWAGEVRHYFTLHSKAGAEAFSLSGDPRGPQLVNSGRLRIALVAAPLAPKHAAGTPAPTYPVTVTIDSQ